MIHIPRLYGLTARSIAMGNASTALPDDPCLAYFNPAGMANTNEGKLGISYIYAQPNFDGGIKGRDRETFEVTNKALSLNIILALDELLKSNRKIAVGINAVLDDNGKAFIKFDDLHRENGYYARYGQSSFMINANFGFEVVEWFYLGAGVLTTLHADANFYTDVDLAGRTDQEGMSLDADIFFSPVGALWLNFDPVNLGLVYRGVNHGRMGPIVTEAENNVGGSKLVDLPIRLFFKDTFTPANLALGVSWHITDSLLLSVDGTWYHWGQFDEEMKKNDLPRDTIDIDMVDTYIPRIGTEYEVAENLFLRFGYSYDSTPVRKPGSQGNYILDNDKHTGALGVGYDLELGIMNYPISLDAAFMHHYMVPNELESSDGTTLESEGNLSGGAASITFRY